MRYIDADRLKKSFRATTFRGNKFVGIFDVFIDDQPTADVVEVVRCDQCRHFEAINNDDHGWCKLISDLPCEMSVRYDDDYCSYGERAES